MIHHSALAATTPPTTRPITPHVSKDSPPTFTVFAPNIEFDTDLVNVDIVFVVGLSPELQPKLHS